MLEEKLTERRKRRMEQLEQRQMNESKVVTNTLSTLTSSWTPLLQLRKTNLPESIALLLFYVHTSQVITVVTIDYTETSPVKGFKQPGYWSRDGALVRVLAFYQCARVWFPDPASYVGWVCCWFSTLLRGFFLWVCRFSPLLSDKHFQIPIRSWNARAFLNGFLWTSSLFHFISFVWHKGI